MWAVFAQEVGELAGIEAGLALRAVREQASATRC